MTPVDLLRWLQADALTLSPLGVFGAACLGGWAVWLWQRRRQ